MKIAERLAVAFYVLCAAFAMYFIGKVATKEPALPLCSVAEISPDFSPADRVRCRVLRSNKM